MQVLKSYQTSQRWENTEVRIQSTGAGSSTLILVTALCCFPFLTRGHSFLPVIPNTQRSQIEDKLHSQERTIAFLLQQAFRIKEDISACLQGTQGFQKEELLARKLLENHIQTITSIVKNLSQNIEVALYFPYAPIACQTINHQCHFSAIEMSCYFLSLSDYNLITSEENSSVFQPLIYAKNYKKLYSKKCLLNIYVTKSTTVFNIMSNIALRYLT